jgi:hypothetical protein
MQSPPDETDRAEEAQAALREGIERARELLCEARLAFRQEELVEAEPPLSAH